MRAALALLVVLAAACTGPRPTSELGALGSCTRLQAQRVVHGRALCENVWTCVRPPGGPLDRVGIRRITACDAAAGPIVLYLPGMHMNAELLAMNPGADFRIFLAENGARVWALDYRTHFVSPIATPDDLHRLGAWTADTFVDDALWAVGFVRAADAGPLHLAGFSFGAGLAYRVAARGTPFAGLVILDGVASGGTAPGPAAIDVGSARLPFEDRAALLAQVRRNPDGPSPIPGAASAGAALADVLYTASSFGGHGGLSNAKGGVSDVSAVAELLSTYDRWWPGAALASPAPTPPGRPLPVLAFASTQLGDAWVERVRASAKAFGGDQAIVRTLPGYGHLDVLVAKQAPRDVYEPIREFVSPVR